MTNPQVDELLADLDRALAIEPSPAVTARVRTSVTRERRGGWIGWHWRTVFASAAALLVVGVIMRPRLDAPPVRPPLPGESAVVRPVTAPSEVAVATVAGRVSGPRPAVARRAEPGPEPEVLVSPRHRLALVQLAAAVRDGRVNADSFPTEGGPKPLDVVRITPIVLDVVRLESGSGGDGGGVIREPGA